MNLLRPLFTKRWILTTILALLGAALCVRLGIWQLDRLEQRRAFNAHVEAMWSAEAVELPQDDDLDLENMAYRAVVAEGQFDYENQVGLRNQYWDNKYGYHLITPLVLEDGTAILVDRGWIPAEGNDTRENWSAYDEANDKVVVQGVLRAGQDEPDFGGRPDPTLAPSQSGLDLWNNVNIQRIEEQLPYTLLNAYIQLDVDAQDETPPIPYQPELELSEGPHAGYAGQWFIFASLLFFGYPFFVKYREKRVD